MDKLGPPNMQTVAPPWNFPVELEGPSTHHLDAAEGASSPPAMPSLKSRLVAYVLKRTRKKAFASPEALHAWLADARLQETHRPPPDVARRLSISERVVAGHPVYEVVPPGPPSARRIVYFHGGAFCFQMTRFHWRLIDVIARRSGMHVTVPVYPLAPQHDFHAMFDFALAVWRDVLAGISADRIAFMGDSAGGNMALVLTMMAAQLGLPGPARHVLISPGLDMTLANAETARVALEDPWLDIPGGTEAVRIYSAGIPPADWRISPTYGDLSVLPPMQIFTGTRDLLYPDTLLFAGKVRAAGIPVDLVVEPGLFHVFPLIDMPEARRARHRMIGYLKKWESEGVSSRPPSASLS